MLELEPFTEALLNDVDELVRFVREMDHPAVRANADISHLHLADASFDDVAKLTGLIGHIHLSDCDGKVHGDLPAGMGVTPIKEYLAGDRRHRLRGHGLDRAGVRARGHQDRAVGAAGLRRHGADHVRARRPLARRLGAPPWTSDCRGKVAIVTGAAEGGLGDGIAARLLEEGCRVVAVDRNAEGLHALVARLGDGAAAHVCDLSTTDFAGPLVAAAQERFGGVDVLVNNAGIYPSHAWDEYSVEEWDATLDVNLRAMWLAGEGGGPGDGRARRRLDRQHRLDHRAHRDGEHPPVRREQGRASSA